MIWTGKLHPSALSETYTVRIEYVPKKPPKVTVLDPALEIPHGEELPHVYPGEELCLCYPWEWDENQLIAHTVVPWASEWLLHYEIWKATGTWCGGGHVTSEETG